MSTPAPLRLPSQIRQRCFGDAAAMATALAEDVAQILRGALAARGQASLRASGGRSPIAFFQSLSTQALDWSQVSIGLVDERWVPADHPDSNARLLREHLLCNAASAAQFVPLANAAATPEAGLAQAEQAQAGIAPDCDVLVLGMGEDGHTASLFPDADETAAAMRMDNPALLAAVHPRGAPHARISLTLPALLRARHLLLPIQGATKRAVLERAVQASPEQLPVAAILRSVTPLTVYYCD